MGNITKWLVQHLVTLTHKTLAMEEPTQPTKEDGPKQRRVTKLAYLLLLAALLVTAGYLRLSGNNWDQNQSLHPDEPFIVITSMQRVTFPSTLSVAKLLDPQTSPLNARRQENAYPYGLLPIYLNKVGCRVVEGLTDDSYCSDYFRLKLAGRALAGLADTITVLLVCATAALLWGRWPGLLAAALYAFAILPIQLSHYYASEPFMTMFMTLALTLSLLFYKTGNPLVLFLAGVSVGLALASKLSAAPVLLLPFALIIGLVSVRKKHHGDDQSSLNMDSWQRRLFLLFKLGAFLGVGVLIGMLMGDPYAVLDPGTYLKQVEAQARVQNGIVDEWYTRRFVGTLPVLYPWWNLVLVGTGPLAGIAGTAGLGIIAARVFRRDRSASHVTGKWGEALLLLGFLSYFLSIAFLEAKWVRYLGPLVPYFCLFATALALSLLKATAGRRFGRVWALANLLLLVGLAVLGAFAFTSIYRTDDTRIAASKWVYENVAPATPIAIEAYEIEMPLPLPGYPGGREQYSIHKLPMLDDQASAQVAAMLHNELTQAEYLIIASSRSLRPVKMMPWRYPVQAHYYDLLFRGELGFTLTRTVASYPYVFGLQVPDDAWVDDSFVEYDHPVVWIFKKDRQLTGNEWADLFAEVVAQPSVPVRYQP